MGFQKGHKLSKGKPKGSLSKRSLDYAEALASNNFNPALALLDVYNKAMIAYESASPDNKASYLSIASQAADRMQPYVYPKLSSIEVKQSNPLEGMSPQEKLELMREAIKSVEQETLQIETKKDD